MVQFTGSIDKVLKALTLLCEAFIKTKTVLQVRPIETLRAKRQNTVLDNQGTTVFF